MRISDWSSDVCSSDLINRAPVSAATYARRFAASNPMSALDRAPEVSDLRNVALTCGGEYSPPLPSNFIVSVLSSPGSLMTIIDRKSTRLTPVTNAHLVCRLLLEKKTKHKQSINTLD